MKRTNKPLYELLAESYPALAKYCPNLPTISAQQAMFVLRDEEEVFYGGSAGGGKSDALLTAALRFADVPGYSALLLRRTYAELEKSDGLIPRADGWLSNTDARRIDGGKKWAFPSGARLEFGHVKDEADKFNFQSAAYQMIGFDELTSFSESIYDYIGFSRARRLTFGKVAKVPIRVRSASNPGNIGHGWVKRRFVDPQTRKPGSVFIPARVSDNPGLDVAQYRATMSHLPEVLQAQLLDGDWGAFEGAAYQIDESAHFVDAVDVQPYWTLFESMDHGVSSPSAWLLWTADTEGDLIVLDSYYRPGLVSEHAAAIKRLRAEGWERKDEDGYTIRNPVYGDPAIRAKIGTETRLGDPASILTEYADHGIGIVAGNNDRKAGYAHLRELLKVDPDRHFPRWHPRYGERGAPRLYVVRKRCPELAEQLLTAPLQPIEKRDAGEIVDPDWESAHGHAHAALRYGAMSRMRASSEPPGDPDADPRARHLHDLLERRRRDWQRRRKGHPRDMDLIEL